MHIHKLKNLTFITLALMLLASCGQKSPEELIKSANSYYETGDFDAAIIELKQLVMTNPENIEARYELGKSYFAIGALEGAAKELERALKNQYKTKETILILSQVYSELQRSSEILDLRKNLEELDPKSDTQLLFYEALALSDLGKDINSKRNFFRITEINDGSEYYYLGLAYFQLLNRNPNNVLKHIEKSLEINPYLYDALWLKANFLKDQQKYSESVISFSQLSKLRPSNSMVSLFLADVLIKSKQFNEADPIVKVLISKFPESAYLNYLKGLLAYQKLNFEEAKSHLEKAIYNGFDNTNGRLLAAFSAYKLEKYEQAYTHLDKIKDKLPPNHPGLRLLVAIQLELGYIEQTLELADSMKFSVADSEFLSSATLKLMQTGNVETARKVLKKYDALELSSVRDIKKLALLKLSLGDQDGISDIETALEIEPTDKSGNKFLAIAYLSEDDLTNAKNLASKLQLESPQDLLGFNLEAMIALKQNDKASAAATFLKSLEIDEYNPLALNFLAEQALLENNVKEAERFYKKILDKYPSRLDALFAYYNVQKDLGNTKQAVELIVAAQELNENDIRYRLLHASVFIDARNPDKVLELLEGVKLDNTLPDYFWTALGDSYLQKRNIKKAAEYFSQWTEFNPDNINAHGRLIAAREIENNITAGLEAINSAEKTLGILPRFQLIKTHFLLLDRNVVGAQEEFDNIPKAYQETIYGKGLLGKLKYADAQYDQALPNLLENYEVTKSVIIAPLIAKAYVKTGQTPKAIDFLEMHLNEMNMDNVSRALFAEILMFVQPEKAIGAYKELLKQQPNNARALNNLAWLLSNSNEVAKALEYARKAVKLEPDEASYLDSLGVIQLKAGDLTVGLSSIEKAHQMAPNSASIWLNYIESLILVGDKKQASSQISLMESKYSNSSDVLSRLNNLSKKL